MKIRISRWVVRAVSVLAVLVLWACATANAPEQSSAQSTLDQRTPSEEVQEDRVQKAASEEAHFEEVARNYRALSVKPQLPEAAHRFAVQAEDAINAKDFNAAADLYRQALEVAPWWPEGHYDRAIVLSETPVAAASNGSKVRHHARSGYAANEVDCNAVMNEQNSGKQTEDIAAELNISRASVRHCMSQARAARSAARASGEPPMQPSEEPSATATSDFKGAILEMKRYLLLVPNAPNARAAQDMIYKWERRASAAN